MRAVSLVIKRYESRDTTGLAAGAEDAGFPHWNCWTWVRLISGRFVDAPNPNEVDMVQITPLKMPKWGLSMTEGTVTHWHAVAGEAFTEGEDLVEIETSKINNVYEAPFSGVIRQIVAEPGEVVQVGGLLAVCAPPEVSQQEIDSFVADFQANFVPVDDDEAEEASAKGIREVAVANGNYRVRITGSIAPGNAVTVLIHGFSGDLNNWMFNTSDLAKLGPVVALELPGHGSSSKEVRDGSTQELADTMRAVLDRLGVERVNLVGHSLGGAVALRMALDSRDLVNRLILLAPAGLPGSTVNSEFARSVADAQNSRELRPILSQIFANPDLATREMVDEVMKFKRLDGADEALALIAEQLISHDPAQGFANELGSTPPTTVILGSGDRIVSGPDQSALPAHWTVHVLDCGHMPHMELSAETNSLIIESLS